MPYLKQPGGTIFFDDTGGSGSPIITTHGFIENGSYWTITGVTDALVNAGYRVINMDLRAHGKSIPSEANPDYSVEAVVQDILALADTLGFEKFHLLTHATGGIVGSRFAMAHANRLHSFIATCTASATKLVVDYAHLDWDDKEIPVQDTSKSTELKTVKSNALTELLRSGISFNQLVADLRADPKNHILGIFFKGFKRNKNPERCWRLVEQIYATNNPIICADFADEFFLDPDPQIKKLRQINCPTMVMVGELDYLMIKFCKQLARNIPNAKYVVLDKVGHMTAIEDPENTSAFILDFLNHN